MSISRKARKGTQRERLLDGMLLAAVRRGYAGANVAQVIAQAGVSRPTFYEYFADSDDCFLAVHRDISEQLLGHVKEAVSAAPPERAVQAGVRVLFVRAQARPDRARFLVNETLAGGHRALEERDRLIDRIEQIIERSRARVSPGALTPDLPTRALFGGICGLLAPRLRRNEYDMSGLADEICVWIDSYNRPTGEHRWRALEPGPAMPTPRHVSELSSVLPQLYREAGPACPPAEIAAHQRERIVYATGEMACEKGYACDHDRRHNGRRGGGPTCLLRPFPGQAGGLPGRARAWLPTDHGGVRQSVLQLRGLARADMGRPARGSLFQRHPPGRGSHRLRRSACGRQPGHPTLGR